MYYFVNGHMELYGGAVAKKNGQTAVFFVAATLVAATSSVFGIPRFNTIILIHPRRLRQVVVAGDSLLPPKFP